MQRDGMTPQTMPELGAACARLPIEQDSFAAGQTPVRLVSTSASNARLRRSQPSIADRWSIPAG